MKFYIVVWDDEQGLCVPYGFDDGCEGAVCASGGDVALFSSIFDAREAIRISTEYAELCKAQGVPANTDFLDEAKKCVKIRVARSC